MPDTAMLSPEPTTPGGLEYVTDAAVASSLIHRRSPFARISSGVEWLFGFTSLILGMAVLTSVPVGQFLVFGYLLEAQGRVARTGRFRDGFPGVRLAARLGGIVAGVGMCWLPLWLAASTAAAAHVIDPGGTIARRWDVALTALSAAFVLHVSAACLRGGRFRHFVNPVNVPWLVGRMFRGGWYREAREGMWVTVAGLRLPQLLWVGVRGFVGTFAWLALPVALLAQGHRAPAVGLLGAALLSAVVFVMPFLQARFARDNRIRAFLAVRAVRADFRHAPLAFALALTFQLLAAIPLYLLKIELIPRDLVFLEGLFFVGFLLPARLLTGWATARGARHRPDRNFAIRWFARLLMLPAVAAYVFAVFTSPHLGWRGLDSLYEQHAFLLPVPFVGFEK